MARSIWLALLIALPGGAAGGAECGYRLVASSFLGGGGDDDAVVGVRIRADGAIVLAANLAADFGPGIAVDKTSGEAAARGTVLVLGGDGRRVLSLVRLAAEVKDLAFDGRDNIYVAAGRDGALSLTPQADAVRWSLKTDEPCDRLDAGSDGHSVLLCGGKRVLVVGPDGRPIAAFFGKGTAADVGLDAASKTVILAGHRNARAPDARGILAPVQIAYLHGVGYDGAEKWTDYDWSTDPDSPRFLDRPGSNRGDTRACRCGIGRDGRLYVALEAGRNDNILRYHPADIMRKVGARGGDRYHQVYHSSTDFKAVFGRFEPATGGLERLQVFTGRTESDHTTNVRVKAGAIAADETGRVFLAGWAQPSLPLDLDPAPDQPRGGPFLLGMTPDLGARLVCTRMHGAGQVHDVDVRAVRGTVVVVYGGGGAEAGMAVRNPLQNSARGKDGFFVILHGAPGAAPVDPVKRAGG
jgi:hypothetical protein